MKRVKSKKAQDFPKKKRKVSKGKQAPENATSVSFTTKAVVVPTQLDETAEPTTKRKLSLQTLLNQLNHYKPSVRRDALSGLREFFQENPTLLAPNLGRLVQLVFTLLVDPEAAVRHALCTFLKFFFTSVVEEHIQSFFSTVVAHLSCGLTHISDCVQLDALKVFDLLLSHHPRLLVPHAQDLLPLLVGLVSRQESIFSSRKKATLESDTALASNPASKLSHQTSRAEIFGHLCRFLRALLDVFEETNGQISKTSSSQAPVVDVAKRTLLAKQDKGGRLEPIHSSLCDFSQRVPHIAVVQRYGVQIPENAFLCGPGTGGSAPCLPSQSSATVFTDSTKLLEFSQTLISLLLECWIECSPMSLLEPSLTSTDSSSLALMETILNLLSLLLKLVLRVSRDQTVDLSLQEASEPSVTEALCERFCADFQKHFMAYFPFFGPSNFNQKPRKYSMNFAVCQIMLLLLSSTPPPKNLQPLTVSKTLSSISDFYASFSDHAKNIVDSTQILASSISSITETLPLLLTVLSTHQSTEETLQGALEGVWSLYEACHPQSAAKRMMIQCFSLLHEGTGKRIREDICSVLRSCLLLPWLHSLPDLFVKIEGSSPETSAHIVVAMATAAVAGDCTYLQGIRRNLGYFLGPSGVVPTLPPFIQRRVCELVWWLPDLQLAELTLLARSICCGRLQSSLMSYLVQIVHHRLIQSTDHQHVNKLTSVQRYLSFMLTVATGYTQDELKAMTADLDSTVLPAGHTSILLTNPSPHVSAEYRVKLQETACECVLAAPFADDALLLLQPAIKGLLEKFHVLPVDTAVGILKLGIRLSPGRGFPDKLVPYYGRLCFSCLVSMETSYPLLSADHCFVSICSEVTERALSLSRSVTQSTINEFRKGLVGEVEASQQRAQTEAFIRLLNSASVNAALRQCREDICSTATSIVDNLLPENEDLKQQLELFVAKFRQSDEDPAVQS